MRERKLHAAVMHAFEKVSEIDLLDIRRKLTDSRHGLGWDEYSARKAELLYRAYLSLILAYPSDGAALSPPKTADDFWHQHILDTRKYIADCNQLFGEYLHHFPYFGMRSDDDEVQLALAFEHTMALIHDHFGDHIEFSELGNLALTSSCSSCSGSCSSCTHVYMDKINSVGSTRLAV